MFYVSESKRYELQLRGRHRPPAAVARGSLDVHAAAHALGALREAHRGRGVDDRLAVAGGERQLLRRGARRDQHAIRGDGLGDRPR